MLLEDPAAEHRCRQIVNDLTLPEPFTLPALVDIVADRVHRPIQLRSVTDIAPGVSAVVINMPHAYVVSYLHQSDPWRALTLVAHELGHILCGHPLQLDLFQQAPGREQHHVKQVTAAHADDSAPAHAQEAPALSIRQGAATPALLGAAEAWGGRLYRCDLLAPHEREAELVATLVLERVEQAGLLTASARPPSDPVAARYAEALLGTQGRRRDRR